MEFRVKGFSSVNLWPGAGQSYFSYKYRFKKEFSTMHMPNTNISTPKMLVPFAFISVLLCTESGRVNKVGQFPQANHSPVDFLGMKPLQIHKRKKKKRRNLTSSKFKTPIF